MKDPVTVICQSAKMSVRAFGEHYKFSRQFMIDVTAGTYTRLPDSIHESLRDLSNRKGIDVAQLLLDTYGSLSLDTSYSIYQNDARHANRSIYLAIEPVEWTDSLSPAHFFVKKTSGTPTRFSKDLKVPPQQVRRWVSGQTKTTPESIELALREIGYPWVRELVENQRAWIEAHE